MAHTPVTGPFKAGTPQAQGMQDHVDRRLLRGDGDRLVGGTTFEEDLPRVTDDGLRLAFAYYRGRADSIKAEMDVRGIR